MVPLSALASFKKAAKSPAASWTSYGWLGVRGLGVGLGWVGFGALLFLVVKKKHFIKYKFEKINHPSGWQEVFEFETIVIIQKYIGTNLWNIYNCRIL